MLAAEKVKWGAQGLRQHECEHNGGEQESQEEEEEEEEQEEGGSVVNEGGSIPFLPARCITSASDAVKLLQKCSIIVGMHPDQAAEAIVDFAITHNKPFACVPCCVYGAEFPGRKLADGRPVRNYDDLVELLRTKVDPPVDGEASYRIEVAELPFEGKNTVVFGGPGR
jgi:hypothetical protein